MRDKKLNLEDLKASHTLGGAGEGDTKGEGPGTETRYVRSGYIWYPRSKCLIDRQWAYCTRQDVLNKRLLSLALMKVEMKRQIPKVTHKEYFSFVDLNEPI
jgi:hypothetical protein